MSCNNRNILDGTNQIERFLKKLRTDYVKIDERSRKDLLKFLYELAGTLAYYNHNNQPEGSIQSFFDSPDDIIDLPDIQFPEIHEDLPPNKALALVFTELFAHGQRELNTLTGRHLDFYYKKILGISPRIAVPDKVQVLFELVKNINLYQYRIPAGTEIDAGMDKKGNSLIYRTDQELIVNRADIKQLSTLFIEEDDGRSKVRVAPVANSRDGIGAPFMENEDYWPAFGEPQLNLSPDSRTMVDATMGFALSSPILILNEGLRKIIITIFFESLDPSLNYDSGFLPHNSISVFCTGDKNWFEPDYYISELKKADENQNKWELKVELEIGTAQPPFTFYDAKVHQGRLDTSWPVMKILLDQKFSDYNTLKPFRVESANFSVEVKGVKNLVIHNDQGVVDPSKPFPAFGATPSINSNLMIGNTEIFQKRLNYLSIDLEWHEIPDNQMGDYYNVYDPGNDINNNSFEANIEMLYNRSWDNVIKPGITLFNSTNAGLPRRIEITQADFNVHTTDIEYLREPVNTPNHPFSLSDERGFIRFRLTGPIFPFKAFGHKEFSGLYSQQALKLAKYDPATAPPGTSQPALPNPPYTPTIKSISLGYKSEEKILPIQNNYDKMYRIGPFGYAPLSKNQTQILPQFNDQGELNIGVAGISAPQTINFLFYIAEGTANEDIVLSPDNISWSYLSNNQWLRLNDEEVLVDSTNNFLTSGIVSVVLPGNATLDNDLLPPGLYWLKVSVDEGVAGASKIRQIHTNAVTATLVTDVEDPYRFDEHLSDPLPPDSLKNLKPRIPQIKRISQPFPSYNGQPTEPAASFYTRVSERLRHKQRAVQIWDFERLVMDAFHDIFKVKCIPHSNPDSDMASGSITMIVVSNLRKQNAANPFKPRTGRVLLEEIKSYLSKYISPFITLYVENPVYESILIDVKIGFVEGFDPGYYSVTLNEELKQFLSPWAFEVGKDIVIGGKIYKSAILLFIESRIYVDYVIDLKLYHIHEGPRPGGIGEMQIGFDFIVAPVIKPAIGEMIIGVDFIVGEDVEVACATTPRSILVTHPKHRIVPLRPDEMSCPGTSDLGIGFMTVGIDFIVSESP